MLLSPSLLEGGAAVPSFGWWCRSPFLVVVPFLLGCGPHEILKTWVRLNQCVGGGGSVPLPTLPLPNHPSAPPPPNHPPLSSSPAPNPPTHQKAVSILRSVLEVVRKKLKSGDILEAFEMSTPGDIRTTTSQHQKPTRGPTSRTNPCMCLSLTDAQIGTPQGASQRGVISGQAPAVSTQRKTCARPTNHERETSFISFRAQPSSPPADDCLAAATSCCSSPATGGRSNI